MDVSFTCVLAPVGVLRIKKNNVNVFFYQHSAVKDNIHWDVEVQEIELLWRNTEATNASIKTIFITQELVSWILFVNLSTET